LPKEDVLSVDGTVIDVLPNALFTIKLENGSTVLGYVSGKMRKNNINILLGDTVTVEISLYDITKGRITYRRK
jgi:translation initiation factor IF-1